MVYNRFSQNRRKAPRVNFKRAINYSSLGDNKEFNGVTKDISEGGLRLISFEYVPENKNLSIEVQLDDDIVKTAGIVVWVKELPYSGRYEIGLEFKPTKKDENYDSIEETRSIVSDYINKRFT